MTQAAAAAAVAVVAVVVVVVEVEEAARSTCNCDFTLIKRETIAVMSTSWAQPQIASMKLVPQSLGPSGSIQVACDNLRL